MSNRIKLTELNSFDFEYIGATVLIWCLLTHSYQMQHLLGGDNNINQVRWAQSKYVNDSILSI